MGRRYECEKCCGAGVVRWGKCFSCNGRGYFSTSTEQREAAKLKRAEKTAIRQDGARQENHNRPIFLAVMNQQRGNPLFIQMRHDHKSGREWTPAQLAAARAILCSEAEAKKLFDGVGEEVGALCRRDGCCGRMDIGEVENCSCHISPPCVDCTSAPLVCPECGAEVEP